MREQNYRFEKAQILMDQNRFHSAEKLLFELLKEDPNDAFLLSLLGYCYLKQDRFEEADKITDSALAISPEDPWLFYNKARISSSIGKRVDAEHYILKAIELDPVNSNFFALLSATQLDLEKNEKALQNANIALKIDPQNIDAINFRSIALKRLKKLDESINLIQLVLRQDPNDPLANANLGWLLLEKGNSKKALEHFKIALSHNPKLEYAYDGLLEALKASNPFYRFFLKYFFWMSNLSSSHKWAFLISFFLLMKISVVVHPAIYFAFIILLFLSWMTKPLSDLFLRLNQYGKLLLNKNDKMNSNFVCLSMGISVLGIILYSLTLNPKFILLIFYGIMMIIPTSVMFSPTKPKNVLLIYSIYLGMTGLIGVIVSFFILDLAILFLVLFFFPCILFSWVANFFLIK